MKKNIKVGISIFHPFTMKLNDKFYGFEVELFEFVAKDLDLNFSYYEKNVDEIIKSLDNNKLDIGLGGFSATERKEKIMDFSHHILSSRFSIAVKDVKMINFLNLFKLISSKEFVINSIKSAAAFILISFILGNLLIYVESGANTFSGSYIHQLFESLWFIVATVATVGYGDIIPNTVIGKLISMVIIFFGIGAFGFYISTINQILGTNKFKYNINSYKDLKNKTVGTLKKSSAHKIVSNINPKKIIDTKNIQDGIKLLKENKIDAFIYDSFVLRDYVENENEKDIHILKNTFGNRNYAFAINDNQSKLKERINRSILKLKEDGTYGFIYKKWFGDDYI